MYKCVIRLHKQRTVRLLMPCEMADQTLVRYYLCRLMTKPTQLVTKDPSFLHQRRLRSDWADTKADLSLCWAHMPLCWFCHEVSHLQNIKHVYQAMNNIKNRKAILFLKSRSRDVIINESFHRNRLNKKPYVDLIALNHMTCYCHQHDYTRQFPVYLTRTNILKAIRNATCIVFFFFFFFFFFFSFSVMFKAFALFQAACLSYESLFT